jgi:hypothetical protein
MRQRVEIYPFDVPKKKRIARKRKSELINGDAGVFDPGAKKLTEEGERRMLHAMNNGMKSVCKKDRVRSR